MSLLNFRPHFDNAYQEYFNKVLVALKVANLRFEPLLKYGETVERVYFNLSNVLVRSVTRGAASTIDTVTDTAELMTVDQEYEAAFHISDGEVTQAGPMNPGEVIGGNIGVKVATDLDSRIFHEILQAAQTFDAGDCTALVSNGTPVYLNVTTVPQMVTRLPAKLKRAENQVLTNMALVVDAYAAGDFAQYLLGKQFDIVSYIWKNGYSDEQFAQAEVYISENLTGETTLTSTQEVLVRTSQPYNAATFNINGVTFRWNHGALAAAGDISPGLRTAAGLLVTFANLSAALSAPGTSSGTYWAHQLASSSIIRDLHLTLTMSGTSAGIIRGRGAGRLFVSETMSNGSFSSPFIHCYYGKKGGIDVVVQDLKKSDMRKTADRRGTNVFSSYLAAIKTFDDGSKKFLDVHIRTVA